jgi:hypothetical protein
MPVFLTAEDAAAIIAADYQTYLGRAPDAGSLVAWQGQLTGGLSETGFIADLAASPEAAGDIGGFYQSVLGRTGSAGEIAGWQAVLPQQSLAAIKADFAASPEAAAEIGGLYRQLLGRAGSAAEVAGWQNGLAGSSLAAVRAGFANSAEAQADIVNLYQQVLGRTPAASEVAGWQSALAGSSLAAVRAGMATSPEAQGDLSASYQYAAGSAPSAGTLAGFEGQLSAGASLSQVTSAIQAENQGYSYVDDGAGTTLVLPSFTTDYTYASGPDRIQIDVAPDMLGIGPSFVASLDGIPLGSPVTVTAGPDPSILAFDGNWGLGAHDLALSYGGAPSTGAPDPITVQSVAFSHSGSQGAVSYTYGDTAVLSPGNPVVHFTVGLPA